MSEWKPDTDHPQRLSRRFGEDGPVHVWGYAITHSTHESVHGRKDPERWYVHVRIYTDFAGEEAELKLHQWCKTQADAMAWADRKIAEALPIMRAMVQS